MSEEREYVGEARARHLVKDLVNEGEKAMSEERQYEPVFDGEKSLRATDPVVRVPYAGGQHNPELTGHAVIGPEASDLKPLGTDLLIGLEDIAERLGAFRNSIAERLMPVITDSPVPPVPEATRGAEKQRSAFETSARDRMRGIHAIINDLEGFLASVSF